MNTSKTKSQASVDFAKTSRKQVPQASAGSGGPLSETLSGTPAQRYSDSSSPKAYSGPKSQLKSPGAGQRALSFPGNTPQGRLTLDLYQAAADSPAGGLTQVSTKPRLSVSFLPWLDLGELAYGCKVLLLSLLGLLVGGMGLVLVWVFLFGSPLHFYAGIHQLVKCGWDSEVVNPWTCDRS